jgi:hypothetical protein
MLKFTNQFLDALVQVQSNPAALIALISFGAFVLVGGALYVVHTAIRKGK